ncbi:SusD/RagB family nutrient-binding outer membrane lipoprotein [Tellurirhabdus bombi]|uniref:SusD/RagB family nutrient-binding outer membrane lipoprotein n=1 Tax=Tellurirhabdus bombi TaxID=2907205 RepID=UPI001F1EBA3B|nr:SusD/RagB family nutrient-binding outer membrane lipoprotein [Tellurirhabdus bombi]
MIRKIKILLLAGCGLFASSCELNLLDNPNAVTVSNTNVNFLLNRIQLDYSSFFNQTSNIGMRLTRMLNQGSALYDNAYAPSGTDGLWGTSYSSLLIDIKTLIPRAESSNLFFHAGISRVFRGYVLATLVDYYGNIPWSQALSAENFNPGLDEGKTIYEVALKDLDDAIADFNKTSSAVPADFFYRGNKDNWIRAAKTIKLKLLLTRRLADPGAAAAINALIAENLLIQTTAQNFTFKFGTNLTNPDSRHPRYGGQYSPTGGGDYQANFYIAQLYAGKGAPDPRLRLYMYRQTVTNTSSTNELSCINNQKPAHYATDMVFCVPTPVGYWGRDHLSNEGIPPDGLRRTAWGLYPAGGLYDNDAGLPVSQGAGAGGAGIHPIMMSSFVDFMLAESALILKTTGTPRTLLEAGVRKSMADVRAFALASSQSGAIVAFESRTNYVWATEVDKYVAKVLALYDAAATDDAKMDVIAREYWLALYGNGNESYNMYRRTGKPTKMQPALEANPGSFVRSLYYPSSLVNRNSSVPQKSNVTVPVFWDTNPATLTN